MTAPRRSYAGGNARFWLMGSALFLTAVGLVMIYSASSITTLAKEGNSLLYLERQLVFATAGWAIALVVGRIDYRRLKANANLLWGVCVGLLVAVLIVGVATNGARRWIPLGIFSLQPSELAKIAVVLAVAAAAVEWQRGRLIPKEFGIRALILTAVPAGLIIVQPDMGTTATLVVAVALVLILAGMRLYWAAAASIFAGILGLLFIRGSEYRWQRVVGFMDPWADPQASGYQTIQALYAFGSGGLDGVGLGLSRQKFFYLPEAHTDFILAIIGEEAGLIGTIAIVVAFCVFVWAGFRVARGARDSFGRLVAGALTGMLGFQAFINMAAVTAIMPVTGKPLPFVSYGGASLLVTMLAVGLVLSVSEYGMLAPRAVQSTRSSKERVSESTRERGRDGGSHLPRARGGRPTRRRA